MPHAKNYQNLTGDHYSRNSRPKSIGEVGSHRRDVLFGALLGIFGVILVENYGPETFARCAILFEHRRPGMFYAFGFLLTYEAGVLFDDIRLIGLGLAGAYRHFGA